MKDKNGFLMFDVDLIESKVPTYQEYGILYTILDEDRPRK
jgi:hypothetical protein